MSHNKPSKKAEVTEETITKTATRIFKILKGFVLLIWRMLFKSFGPTKAVIISLLALYLIFSKFPFGLLFSIFFVVLTSVWLVLLKNTEPVVLLTSERTFKWKLLYPGLAILVPFCTMQEVMEKKIAESNLEQSYEVACSEEGLSKTGKIGCENAKKDLFIKLNDSLKYYEQTYKIETEEVAKLIKEQKNKCNETGIDNYGSQSCEDIAHTLKLHQKDLTSAKDHIDSITKKLNSLKN